MGMRTDTADPARFGINVADIHRLWYVAQNLIRDLAALNRVEMLPWDVWGELPGVST